MSLPLPTPLTPDDESSGVTLATDRRQPVDNTPMDLQPYGLEALLLALLVLISLHASSLTPWTDLWIAAVVGVIVYLALRSVRPRVPLRLLSVIAAVSGLILGLPDALIYHQRWSAAAYPLLFGVLLAGLVGWLLSLEGDERHPGVAIAASFLAMFVLANLMTVLLPVLG